MRMGGLSMPERRLPTGKGRWEKELAPAEGRQPGPGIVADPRLDQQAVAIVAIGNVEYARPECKRRPMKRRTVKL
jgi:hypothetical protein